jgi:hypothetical protein
MGKLIELIGTNGSWIDPDPNGNHPRAHIVDKDIPGLLDRLFGKDKWVYDAEHRWWIAPDPKEPGWVIVMFSGTGGQWRRLWIGQDTDQTK